MGTSSFGDTLKKFISRKTHQKNTSNLLVKMKALNIKKKKSKTLHVNDSHSISKFDLSDWNTDFGNETSIDKSQH
jgi:hypothetical protein